MEHKVLQWFSWRDVTRNPGEAVRAGELPDELVRDFVRSGVLAPAAAAEVPPEARSQEQM
jgi:hypothetical protein